MTTKSKASEEKDPEVAIENVLGKTESFLMQNGRSLLIGLAVVVVVVGGFFGYKYLVAVPREAKASTMMYVAEQHFAVDSFQLALNGDGSSDGFLQVIKQYGSTSVGNLAKHYAGVCYLHLGDYAQALQYLKQYSSVKGIPGVILNAQNLGLQGDALAEQGNYKEAADMYQKAVKAGDNELTSPVYLKKMGLIYEKLGENAKAIEAYKTISTDYAASLEARDIQKYIGRLEQQL